MCQERDSEVVKGVLPYWSKIYCKISVVSCSFSMLMMRTHYQGMILYVHIRCNSTIIILAFLNQDHDRRIREATQQAFEQLVSKVGRSLAPFLKSLMGHWILSQCDPYTPSASAACQAFQAAFSPSKQPEALNFCKDEILNVSSYAGYKCVTRGITFILHLSYNFLFQVIQDILLKETADTLSDPQ